MRLSLKLPSVGIAIDEFINAPAGGGAFETLGHQAAHQGLAQAGEFTIVLARKGLDDNPMQRDSCDVVAGRFAQGPLLLSIPTLILCLRSVSLCSRFSHRFLPMPHDAGSSATLLRTDFPAIQV
ncbi:MAG: hypothetical protein HZA66_17525 [Rhodopseudomonas palustris]|uniref:Uncharacterized protein n=1 Tax=Rhodopseudomonas palustris TaxID=1076 RepID=A0A933W3G2_RHOPL|nr:hypothetical protein [Rhodopseudomonas palustris]